MIITIVRAKNSGTGRSSHLWIHPDIECPKWDLNPEDSDPGAWFMSYGRWPLS